MAPTTRARGAASRGPLRTTAQAAYDKNILRVKKTWPVKRKNKKSRGINGSNNTCFQNTALQGILHLPRLMHWIMTHNTPARGGFMNPCRPPKDMYTLVTDGKERYITGRSCIACHLKTLIQTYWGELPVGVSDEFRGHDPEIATIEAWTRLAYRQDPIQQHDAGEHFEALVKACRECTDPDQSDPDKDQKTDHYDPTLDALLVLRLKNSNVCNGCKQPRVTHEEYWHLPVGVLRSVSAGIQQYMATEALPDYKCDKCKRTGTQLQKSFEAAPEILRVKLNIVNPVTGTKNTRNHPRLDQELDLTRYQANPAVPLKYKLVGVMAHCGPEIDTGHWISNVQGPKQVFRINEGTATASTNPNSLAQNPVIDRVADRCQAVYVTYVRVRDRQLAELLG
ncbi:cysteine proteinase [Sporormia fimetaria CBS 119925]|uniref:Cysteine proteinase n=1 Tax=Sporormia fimetaria CBS 119925 TaxID=1340428 RepID=A0A6A6V8A9_9PLEO|nr:cysteine proteinase [Sporormia fimetaria CBS 119925]